MSIVWRPSLHQDEPIESHSAYHSQDNKDYLTPRVASGPRSPYKCFSNTKLPPHLSSSF
ncbi:hypothetical protein HETIRDRAFT_170623 [Heterobasidion irregulare TC 32-1]|uniref:Uncharacterized protein n=1 Tax=Heterobasidion irregulare (strain TC 32-1) TaxID=747525 RepID=W4KGD7_HETIT|nr:uncharacterized protein HETIRDRAFT_170623 [Heterobasidion irregulare TC 32-1]ETW84136.1 hypothetical protein HETIRDRAFT_170623 [Heterobasidion irregulare TC 32-1]